MCCLCYTIKKGGIPLLLFYRLALSVLFSSLVAFAALFLRWLTPSGTVAAILSGTLIMVCGPWYSVFLVGFFFMSSGIISLAKRAIQPTEVSYVNKGSQRDLFQVLANILPSLIALCLYQVFQIDAFLLAYVAGIASCTADTWGSDIGVLSRKPPRHLLSGKRLAPGLSGGVSLLGTFASFTGSVLITAVYAVSLWLSGKPFLAKQLLLLIALGFFGSLIDSLLGATIQVRYQCPVCGQFTEKKIHHDQATKPVSGWTFITNEGVNLLSNLLIVVFAILLFS